MQLILMDKVHISYIITRHESAPSVHMDWNGFTKWANVGEKWNTLWNLESVTIGIVENGEVTIGIAIGTTDPLYCT